MLNIQHLATPIRAQLAEPCRSSSSPGCCIPTPAVGREPHAVAEPLIPRSRAWTAAGTPARSAGRTPTRTASSASPCAAPCSRATSPAATRASASWPTPTRRPSSPRRRSSCRRSCPCSAL
jgi:hypothetical protein